MPTAPHTHRAWVNEQAAVQAGFIGPPRHLGTHIVPLVLSVADTPDIHRLRTPRQSAELVRAQHQQRAASMHRTPRARRWLGTCLNYASAALLGAGLAVALVHGWSDERGTTTAVVASK